MNRHRLATLGIPGAAVALLCDPPHAPAPPEPATPIDLNPTTRAVWFGSARLRGVPLGVVVVLLVFLMAAAISRLLSGAGVTALVLVFSLAAALTFLRVDVRVDAEGTHWRLLPGLPRGLPRGTIPHATVTRAGAVDIRPGDWGGWGWRLGLHGQAILIRSGPGIRLQRGRRDLYITVDDAARGAALIEAYRRNPASSPAATRGTP